MYKINLLGDIISISFMEEQKKIVEILEHILPLCEKLGGGGRNDF